MWMGLAMRSQAQDNVCGAIGVRLVSTSTGVRQVGASSLPLFALVVAGLWMAAAPRAAVAKSLYVIADIHGGWLGTPINAYNIGADGKLTFQKQYNVPMYGSGAVGLALDSKSKYLFITNEDFGGIVVLDPTTMADPQAVTAPAATNLAGIVYDQSKDLLYCVDRSTPTLYVYQWSAETKMLTAAPGSPFRLAGAMGFGMAVDEVKGELYVGGPMPAVRVYSTSDWHLIRTIPVSHIAISVAVDSVRRYLYLGGGYPVTASYFLTQHDLVTDQERQVTVDPNAGVMGLGVDAQTGFVYVSTGRNNEPGGDDLLVFDTNLKQIDVVEDIGNPTGLVIPSGPVSYNPLRLTKTVKTPAGYNTATGQDLPQVILGAEFTYTICFDHNDLAVTDVSVVDKLPPEVAFVRATGDGVSGKYDRPTHTYTWLNPPRAGGSTTCLELVCRVEPNTPVGRIFANSVTLRTRQTPPTTTTMEVVTLEAKVFQPLHVSKTVRAGATGGSATTPASANAGSEVTYRITFDNQSNAYPVENVRLTDSLPPQAAFVRATGDRVFGQYEPVPHTYVWSYPRLAPGESNSVDVVLRLDTDVAGGATITNAATVESDNTAAARTSVDLKVASYAPFQLRKTLTSGAAGQPDDRGRPHVNVGGTLTYTLSFTNPAPNGPATQVSLVDTLPREVSFVSADGDRDFGFYDPNTRTYTWRYASVEPGREQRLSLVVRVNENTKADTVISNAASITSKQTAATNTIFEVVTAAAQAYKPLHVTKTVIAGATGGGAATPASVNAGDEITYRITFDNKGNDSTVENVRLTDDLPRPMSFVRATDDRLFGRYDPLIHTYTWSYARLASKETKSVDLVVRLDQNATGGAIMTNTVIATGDRIPSAQVSADTTVVKLDYTPLTLRKTLVSGAVGQPDSRGRPHVEAGGTLTYALYFSNPPANKTVTQVALVDTLPREVSFVRADGDRDFGSYDLNTHTYTWRYAALAPGAEKSVNLVVRVNDKVDPNTVIANAAAITSKEAATTRASSEAVVRAVITPPVRDVTGVVYVKPDHIYRNDSTAKSSLMVVVHLPEGIGMGAINSRPLVLTPGNVQATGQQIFGTSTQGKVLCYFDVAPILAATQGYGQFTLRVAGKLNDGRSFLGEAPLWILKFGGP